MFVWVKCVHAYVCIYMYLNYFRYMHYKTRPFIPSPSGGGEVGRAASYAPRSATNTTRPVNDLRCMPVYEELDNAEDMLPRPPV